MYEKLRGLREQRDSAHRIADIIRPNNDGKNPLPERELQISYGKQPPCEPEPAPQRVLLDADILRHRTTMRRMREVCV